MSAKHLIVGTAGHIDHGKTALIRALTGYECDTHKEEKLRGITIHLGFTHLDLPNGDTIGVVDVPGHAAFVRTMVAGASGVDFAILVVAADSGVMPQTQEHLQILQVLGVKRIIVAITKIDLVDDEEMLDIAEEEVLGVLEGTPYEDSRTVRVSSVTGEGIDTLKALIAAEADLVAERPGGEVFRMFADRIFTVQGFGTVVTGSVLSGEMKTGDTAYLLPADNELRVRRLERFGEEAEIVVPGDRASMNLVGLSRDEFKRGMVISDRVLRSTSMFDARLRLFSQSRSFNIWSKVNLHLGTYEAQVRLHLIDRDRAAGGDDVLVQLHLPTPIVAQLGDRFVIRSSSSDLTLGGGEVIDPFPLHHKRRPDKLVEHMQRIADGKAPELIAAEIRKSRRPIGCDYFADLLNMADNEVEELVRSDLDQEDIVLFERDGTLAVFSQDGVVRLRRRIIRAITAFHKRNPLEPLGMKQGDILGQTGWLGDRPCELVCGLVLQELEQSGRLKCVKNTWAAADHDVVIGPELQRQIQSVNDYLKGCGMQTPLMSKMLERGKRLNMGERDIRRILRYLMGRGKVYTINDNFLHGVVVDGCRRKLLEALVENEQGLTISEFRDLVDGNRKICLLLIAIYDNEGITRRSGDYRLITDKGRAVLNNE